MAFKLTYKHRTQGRTITRTFTADILGGGDINTGFMRCHDIHGMLENNWWIKNHYQVNFNAPLQIREIYLKRSADSETDPYVDNLYIGSVPLTGQFEKEKLSRSISFTV